MFIQDTGTKFYYAGMTKGVPKWTLSRKDALDVVHIQQVGGLINNLKAKGFTCVLTEPDRPLGYNDHPAPFAVFGRGAVPIDEAAVTQLLNVLRIIKAYRGAQMPDAQLGYTISIGGVVALLDAVMPMGVGVDIGCLMMLSVLDMPTSDFYNDRLAIWDIVKRLSGMGVGKLKGRDSHPVMANFGWNEIPILYKCFENAFDQLGTLGRGNHFVDVGITEIDGEKKVVLLTHGGSRNTGKLVAEFYAKLAEEHTQRNYKGVPKGMGWLELDTDEGREYWVAMELLAEYAKANHELTHSRIASALGTRISGRYTNAHNIATKENGVIVMRKGAIRVAEGDYAIIPGSSGTISYLVRGKNDPNAFSDNLNSGPHGAGRVGSTSSSKKKFKEVHESGFEKDMRARDIWTYGVDAGETYHAYKDIEQVVKVMVDAGALEIVATIQPKLVVMGGKETADDAN